MKASTMKNYKPKRGSRGYRYAALVAAATLTDKHITDRFLPDKAIDLIDETASALRIDAECNGNPVTNAMPVLDESAIALQLARRLGRSVAD